MCECSCIIREVAGDHVTVRSVLRQEWQACAAGGRLACRAQAGCPVVSRRLLRSSLSTRAHLRAAASGLGALDLQGRGSRVPGLHSEAVSFMPAFGFSPV